MNSPFVAIVLLYGIVVRHTVLWSPYRFTDFTRLKQLLPCIIIHKSLYVLSHITAWTQGRPWLPAPHNSGRFLTIPLTYLHGSCFLTMCSNPFHPSTEWEDRIKKKPPNRWWVRLSRWGTGKRTWDGRRKWGWRISWCPRPWGGRKRWVRWRGRNK